MVKRGGRPLVGPLAAFVLTLAAGCSGGGDGRRAPSAGTSAGVGSSPTAPGGLSPISSAGTSGTPGTAGTPGSPGTPGTGTPGTGAPGTGTPGTGAPGTPGAPGVTPVPAGTPSVGVWRARARMSTPRAYAVAVTTDTGRIFVLGGTIPTQGGPVGTNEEYDPVADRWIPRAPMPTPRWRHGAAFLNGKIYVVGGNMFDGFSVLFGREDVPWVDVYDVATDTWSAGPSLAVSAARRDLSVVAFQGRVCALSGTIGGPLLTAYPRCDLLDPAGSGWTSGPDLLVGDSDQGAVAGGRIWTVGGGVTGAGELYWLDSLAAGAFSRVSGVIYPVGKLGGRCVGLDGRLYFLGGLTWRGTGTVYGSSALRDVQSLDATAATPPTRLYRHASMLEDRGRFAVTAREGRIYVFGGIREWTVTGGPFGMAGASAMLDSVEEFTPGAPAGPAWQAVNQGLGSLAVRGLVVDPSTPGTVWAGTQGGEGVYKSLDGGATWSPSGAGFPLRVNALAMDQNHPQTVYLASEGAGIYRTDDGGLSWSSTNGALPLTTRALVSAPVLGSMLLAAPEQSWPWSSQDSGQTWVLEQTGGAARCLAIDPLNANRAYLGGDQGVLRTLTLGGPWVASGLSAGPVTALATGNSANQVLYAGTAAGAVHRSDDAGATFVSVAPLPGGPQVLTLAVDPRNPDVVYAGTSAGVFRSADGGASWIASSGGIGAQAVHALTIDPTAPLTVYAATDTGVWKSVSGGQ